MVILLNLSKLVQTLLHSSVVRGFSSLLGNRFFIAVFHPLPFVLRIWYIFSNQVLKILSSLFCFSSTCLYNNLISIKYTFSTYMHGFQYHMVINYCQWFHRYKRLKKTCLMLSMFDIWMKMTILQDCTAPQPSI